MKKILLLFSIFMWGIFSSTLADHYQMIRVYLSSAKDLDRIVQAGIDLEGSRYKRDMFIDLQVSMAEKQVLQEIGFQTEILIDDLEFYYASRLETRAGEGFGYGSMGGYYTYSEVMANLDSMITLYPQLISPKDTIGYSILGKPIVAVKISDNPTLQETEPEILYTGLHHAREPVSMMNILYYMWHLLENYGTDARATYLVDNRQMWFVPVVNPDGYVYNQQTNPGGGGMWRLNARDNNDNGIYFQSGIDGVDLNRNYGYQWGYNNSGSSPTPGDQTYRGPYAFSEVETQAIRNFCNNHQFVTGFNYHTYSNLLIHPWAYNDSPTPDHFFFQTFGYELTRFNGYVLGTPSQTVGYSVNGDANDWMYGEQTTKPKIISYTPEVGSSSDGFWPPTNRILPLVQENLYPNIILSYIAGSFPRLYDKNIFVYGANQFIEPGEVVEVYPGITNFGLQSTAPLQTELLPITNNFELLNGITTLPALNSFDSTYANTPWLFRVNYHTAPGNLLRFKVDIYENGTLINSDFFDLMVGFFETAFSSDFENGISSWVGGGTGGSWGLTTSSSHSPTHSLTDSPSGNYNNNANYWIRTPSISLANASTVTLSYWTKWAIEADWDFGIVELSTNNGGSWTSLVAPHMTPGSGTGMQPSGQYGYDGVQNTWVEETIDLSLYAGQNIQLRFHLLSDGWVTEDGWYIDDFKLQILNTNTNIPPYVKTVDQLSPQIFTGAPYPVSATILDDRGIEQATLFYSTDNGINFQTLPMTGSDSMFSTAIPPLSAGLTVRYYVQAWDSAGSYSVYPYNAPQQCLSFSIQAGGPVLVVNPTLLNFQVPQLLSQAQPLRLSNPGTDPVSYQITDTSTHILQQQHYHQGISIVLNSITELLKKHVKLPPNKLSETLSARSEQEVSGQFLPAVVINDSVGDVSNPSNDIVSVEFSETVFSYNVEITFAAAPETSSIGLISFDTDQDFSTGVYPAPLGYGLGNYDIGSEYEITFDFPNLFGDSLSLPPSVYVFDVRDTSLTMVGLPIPIQFNSNSALVSLPKILYPIFDSQMNIAATMVDLLGSSLPDLAPDFGHGNLGGELGSSWISELDANGHAGYPLSGVILPGDSALIWVRVAAAYPPGAYQGSLHIANNSPLPIIEVPVQMTIESPGIPQISVDPVLIADTLQFQSSIQNYNLTIHNTGNGSLFYTIIDTIFNGSGWLEIDNLFGIIAAGEVGQINVQVDPTNLAGDSLYLAELRIISNDPVSPETVIPVQIFISYPTQIAGKNVLPKTLALYANYPNPFNPTTTIAFDLPASGKVKLEIFNILGQRVKVLADSELPPGHYQYVWNTKTEDGQSLAAGIYFYKLQSGERTIVKKMILSK